MHKGRLYCRASLVNRTFSALSSSATRPLRVRRWIDRAKHSSITFPWRRSVIYVRSDRADSESRRETRLYSYPCWRAAVCGPLPSRLLALIVLKRFMMPVVKVRPASTPSSSFIDTSPHAAATRRRYRCVFTRRHEIFNCSG